MRGERSFFFFNDTATTEIYTLSLHDALPIFELHGTSREVMCIRAAPRCGNPDGCGFRAPIGWALAEVERGAPDPACPDCGGPAQSVNVRFAQPLFPRALEAAAELLTAAHPSLP